MEDQDLKLADRKLQDPTRPKAFAGHHQVAMPKAPTEPGADLTPHPCPMCAAAKRRMKDGPCQGHAEVGGGSSGDEPTACELAELDQLLFLEEALLQAALEEEEEEEREGDQRYFAKDSDASQLRLQPPQTGRFASLGLTRDQIQLLLALEMLLGYPIPRSDLAVSNGMLVINLHDANSYMKLLRVPDVELHLSTPGERLKAQLMHALNLFHVSKGDLGAVAKRYEAMMKAGALVVHMANPQHFRELLGLFSRQQLLMAPEPEEAPRNRPTPFSMRPKLVRRPLEGN